jgi:uncharacterized protein with PQ loop repeat
MLITFSIGLVLWVAYGVATVQTPVVITNVVTLFLVLVLLWVKITPDRP